MMHHHLPAQISGHLPGQLGGVSLQHKVQVLDRSVQQDVPDWSADQIDRQRMGQGSLTQGVPKYQYVAANTLLDGLQGVVDVPQLPRGGPPVNG